MKSVTLNNYFQGRAKDILYQFEFLETGILKALNVKNHVENHMNKFGIVNSHIPTHSVEIFVVHVSGTDTCSAMGFNGQFLKQFDFYCNAKMWRICHKIIKYIMYHIFVL